MNLRYFLRATYLIAVLVLVESVIFGLSIMPGLLTYQLILSTSEPYVVSFLHTALLGFAFVPSYLVFSIALMILTALFTRALGWRATAGVYRISRLDWPLVRWAQYNAAIHMVRVFAGGLLRATPLWTWFIRINGASVGSNVRINNLSVYEHNLLSFGDGVVVGANVQLACHLVEDGHLHVGPIVLGRSVTIGSNSIVHPGVVVGDRTQVGTMSLVLKNAALAPDSVYAGSPVRLVSTRASPSEATSESVP